ncbi:PREDICTED: transcription termination factor 3, mitochondrial [Hipposideros armiger]|uniref:Transcription termination factor 3, mitochondrial n=1 Tax=Hipposideros armiger TaxID=186990 RepID=A0A8B7QCA5_HIPAR|nr:PREDICTED: transcription termination factor 3, mitochondrial [Hipposideros armiger]
MHLVVHIIFAQGPASHAGRHGPPPRPAAAAAAPARGGWDPGGDAPQRATLRKMALLAQWIPRRFNSIKLNSFITATQLRNCFLGPGKTLLHGISAQSQMSSDNCFLQWGFKTYRTSSVWNNSSQSTISITQQINSAQSTALPSMNEPSLKIQKIPNFDSELSLEGNSELGSISILQTIFKKPEMKMMIPGVDLSKIEKHPDAANRLLRMDFEKDIKQILLFLKDLGIEDNQLGPFLTKNYAIFSEDLENLKTRVAYLQSKNFSKADITQMVKNAPFLLNFSVERLDNRLGFFQKELELSVKKTRDLVVRLPRLLTGSLEPVKENMKVG